MQTCEVGKVFVDGRLHEATTRLPLQIKKTINWEMIGNNNKFVCVNRISVQLHCATHQKKTHENRIHQAERNKKCKV